MTNICVRAHRSSIVRPSAIIPAPAFSRVRGTENFSARLQKKKGEGPGAPSGAWVFPPRGGRTSPAAHRLTAAPVRRRSRAFASLCAGCGGFSVRGRAFREAYTSPSASSSRRLLVAGGGAPYRPGVRGCEPRPRAPISRAIRRFGASPGHLEGGTRCYRAGPPACRSTSRRL
jgi:hypothetical protein